jgi:ATP-binding cassette, subfamily B, bacterial
VTDPADPADPADAETKPASPLDLLPRPLRVLKNVRHTIAMARAAAPGRMLAVIAVSAVTGVVGPLTLLATAHLIDGIVARPASWTHASVLWPVIALGVLAAIARVLGAFQERLNDTFSDRVWLVAHKRFLAHVANVDLGLFDDSKWHDRLERARADVGWRPYSLTATLINILGSSVTLLTLFSALFVLDPRLLVLGVVSVLPTAWMRLQTNRAYYQLHWTTTKREREHDYMITIASHPMYAKDVRAFGLGPHVVERARNASLDRMEQKARLYRRANALDSVGAVLASAVLLVAYFAIADAGTTGSLSVGEIAAIFGAFTSVTAHLASTMGSLVTIDQHAQFLDDYFAFLALEPTIVAPPQPKAVPAPLDHVALEGVSFRYGGRDHDALGDVDLRVQRGQVIALVGENGAGKSTLVKLLLRFFDPSSGVVRFGGVDARDLDPTELRKRIGVLFQDYGQYHLLLSDVIGFGRVDEPFDEARAWAAIEKARATEIVKELGGGMKSVVGRLFEGGHDLSGGQWQRLALARLIYRDADLWILDEPTANLDPAAEQEIFEELRGLLAGRMGIVISHRFSTVRMADEILVLENGRVVERGNHDALMRLDGRYADMFRKQAEGYR